MALSALIFGQSSAVGKVLIEVEILSCENKNAKPTFNLTPDLTSCHEKQWKYGGIGCMSSTVASWFWSIHCIGIIALAISCTMCE
jgi:hypothetical protein